MNQAQILQLEDESKMGGQARHAHETFIKPFVNAKLGELFVVFCDTSGLEVDKLQELHRMAIATQAIDAELQRYMTTGDMANKTLEQEG